MTLHRLIGRNFVMRSGLATLGIKTIKVKFKLDGRTPSFRKLRTHAAMLEPRMCQCFF